jgi:hypothetical protein
MGVLQTLLTKALARKGYSKLIEELASAVIRDARISLDSDGKYNPTRDQLHDRARKLYLQGAAVDRHNLIQRMDMSKAIARRIARAFGP